MHSPPRPISARQRADPCGAANKRLRTCAEAFSTGKELLRSGFELFPTGFERLRTGNDSSGSGFELLRTGKKPLRTGPKVFSTGFEPLRSGNKPLRAGYEVFWTGNDGSADERRFTQMMPGACWRAGNGQLIGEPRRREGREGNATVQRASDALSPCVNSPHEKKTFQSCDLRARA